MKCELCHKNDAQAAITRMKGDEERELYVCNDCAKKERVRRQQKSQRTRKVSGLPPGMSMSITEISSEGGEGEPPPILGALFGALGHMVDDIKKESEKETPKAEPSYHVLPCERAEALYRVGSRLHLEGLSLIGEMESVHRAMRALRMRLAGIEADGVREAGHVYALEYTGSSERARRVAENLLAQERNARIRLFEEMPRVFGDALCRALAILKNCRLLSPGELFDLLSPLRIGAAEKMLDGVTRAEIERWMKETDLTSREDNADPAERDKIDAARADRMNERFQDVVLNERAEEKFL